MKDSIRRSSMNTSRSSRRRIKSKFRLEELEPRLLLSSYLVNDPGDSPLGSTHPGETAAGTITLRSAIQQVNIDGGGEISFLPGPPILIVTTGLPPITASGVSIGSPGPADVTITPRNPTLGGTPVPALDLEGSGDSIGGLTIEGFFQTGIIVNGSFDSIGAMDISGTYQFGIHANGDNDSFSGIRISGTEGEGVLIVGDMDSFTDSVISDSAGDGLGVQGSDNTVDSNTIGTDASGTQPMGNIGAGVFIGGNVNTVSNNVVSANFHGGLQIVGDDNLVEGNHIGTDSTGSHPLGNGDPSCAVLPGGRGHRRHR